MGLKFKRFKAKLIWKSKQSIPDIVCLRYQENSEFVKSPDRPIASPSQLETNEVIKQNKIVPKGPIKLLFDEDDTTTINDLTKVEDVKSHINGNSSGDLKMTNTETAPIGLPKKSSLNENVIFNRSSNILIKETNYDDTSALIFMTENHDELEECEDASEDVEPVDIRNKQAAIDKHEKTNFDTNLTSDYEFEKEEVKTVRWRETVIEIQPKHPNKEKLYNKETTDDFKIHFAKHQSSSTDGIESEEYESGDDGLDMENYFINRSMYNRDSTNMFFPADDSENQKVRDISH